MKPLTPAEVTAAIALERQAVPEIHLPLGSRPMASVFATQPMSLQKIFPDNAVKQADPDVTILGAPGAGSSDAPRRAIVSRFDYLTGLSVATTVDLDAGKVLDVKVGRDRPAPLSADEFKHAVDLAIEADTEIKQLASEFGRDKLQFDALTPIDSLRSSPRYGHRLILLWVEEPRPSKRVMVDLTTQKVSTAE